MNEADRQELLGLFRGQRDDISKAVSELLDRNNEALEKTLGVLTETDQNLLEGLKGLERICNELKELIISLHKRLEVLEEAEDQRTSK
jgi:hypothetical protein